METQVSFRLRGWHAEQLKALARESELGPCTVARQLLMAAVEQASGDPPPKVDSTQHLQRFYRNGRGA